MVGRHGSNRHAEGHRRSVEPRDRRRAVVAGDEGTAANDERTANWRHSRAVRSFFRGRDRALGKSRQELGREGRLTAAARTAPPRPGMTDATLYPSLFAPFTLAG